MLPILYQNHDLVVYSYPLMMGLGWGVAYQIFMSGLPVNLSRTFTQFVFWGLFVSSWIGAKALFLMTNPDGSKLVEDVNFWMGGGFVFYGGLIAGGVFLVLVKYLRSQYFSHLIDALLPAMVIGHALGRIGCFLAGCCYGKMTDAFWAIHQHGEYRHPTQLLEVFGLSVIAYFLFKIRASKKNLIPFYLVSYGVLRIGIESLRGDEVRGSWLGTSPSLILSLILVLVGFGLFYKEKTNT